MNWLRRLWCRAVGHAPVKVPLGGCPKAPLGLWCPVFATCCERCRRELPEHPRECGFHGGPECPEDRR